MEFLRLDDASRAADLRVPRGCPLCDGDVVVRTTPHRTWSWSHCARCLRLSRSHLAMTPLGLRVVQPVSASA